MSSIFGSDSAYSRFMNKLGDIILLSIVWVVCSLPIVTMGTAACAAYYTAAKVIRRRNGYVFREFMKSFRQNFIPSIGLNLIYLLAFAALVLNFLFLERSETEFGFYLRCIYLVMGVILIGLMLHSYILLSRFELGAWRIFTMAFVITFKHLPVTLGLAAVCTAGVVLEWLMPWAILILPGLAFFVMTFLAERILLKYMPKPKDGSKEAEIWYYN